MGCKDPIAEVLVLPFILDLISSAAVIGVRGKDYEDAPLIR